jgi:CheY-like chemotaxis protein/HPt (histidine-containing phosphotransfer) domain-containing protein
MKPVKESELFDAVATALHIAVPLEPTADAEPRPFAGALRPLHVLLAEDSVVNQKLAVALLKKHGHTVEVVQNGKEAVAAANRGKFDVILMDVQMPEMDGIEATAVIRTQEKQNGGHLPIIAMTAHAMKGDREACLQAGMDEYVAKPVRARELFAAIARVLGDGEAPAKPQDAAGDAPVVNWAAVMETVQDDRELLAETMQAFLEECPKLLEQIRTAVEAGDDPTLHRAAHTLKGSLRLFGAERAAEWAQRLESIAKDGRIHDAQPVVAPLEEELEQVVRAMRSPPF